MKKSRKQKRSSAKAQGEETDDRLAGILGDHYQPPKKKRWAEDVDVNSDEFADERDRIELVRLGHGLEYNPTRDLTKTIQKLVAYGGNCICRPDTPCPCPELIDDIKKKGKCLCGVFVVNTPHCEELNGPCDHDSTDEIDCSPCEHYSSER